MRGRRCVCLAIGVLASSGTAGAVVVSDAVAWAPPAVESSPRFIGRIIGGSGVAIGPRWVATATHVGASLGSHFALAGETYIATQVRRHPSTDLTLIEVDRDMPGWHPLANRPLPLEPVLLAGFGNTRGAALSNGYSWDASDFAIGANRVESLGTRLGVRFDAPDSPNYTPGESLFAIGDSGGGLFTLGEDGLLELAGLAVSISGDRQSTRFNDWAYAVNLDSLQGWIIALVFPGTPVSSSTPAPRPTPPSPTPGTGLALLTLGAWAGTRRRRVA
jgi:hypothetical protein